MALDQRQAFKVAFLLRCAEEGLTLEETHAVVKQALDALQPPREKQALGALSTLLLLGLSPIPAGAVAGGLAGHFAGKAVGGEGVLPEELQANERIDAYQQATDAARARIAQARQRQVISGNRKPTPRRLMV
jgi:hypothetical protein